MTEQYETMSYSIDNQVATIEFTRPERRNATDLQFYEDLHPILNSAEADPDVRVVVIRAAGPAWAAGQDLKFANTATEEDWARYVYLNREARERLRRLYKPVIARVHGDAIGGGTYLATSCDLIVMMDTARMSMREIQAGESSGGALFLTLGKQRSLELNLLGRYIAGEEAERWGLINKSVSTEEELDAQVADWSDQLLHLPPLSLRMTKIAHNFMMDAGGFDLHRRVGFPDFLLHTEDRLEAKRAWNEKRKPVFKGK
jgi:enoyl-CoA hydratase/carnithine racemase